jgi:putative transposase
MLAHCGRDHRGLVSAALREVFNADDRDHARERVGHVLERLEPAAPKVCRLLEEAEEDLIAFYAFPSEHQTKLRSTDKSVKYSGFGFGEFRMMDRTSPARTPTTSATRPAAGR